MRSNSAMMAEAIPMLMSRTSSEAPLPGGKSSHQIEMPDNNNPKTTPVPICGMELLEQVISWRLKAGAGLGNPELAGQPRALRAAA
jgi:hypothetical protein